MSLYFTTLRSSFSQNAIIAPMFLPTEKSQLQKLGHSQADIILISGDAYIDSPFMGTAVIGNYLTLKGFVVAIIAQPDINTDEIARLGEPKLFWGISAGAMDSFVSNWTALNKFRNEDDLTPGGINNRRPDRASMVYTNIIRRHFKNTKPIVLGGVEASLRRIAHYDFKDDALRRSILFDAKADMLIYGMGEKTSLELATALKNDAPYQDIPGLCYISREKPADALEINSFEDCAADKNKFFSAFKAFSENQDRVLIQKHNDRFLIHNPAQEPLNQAELDEVYDMPFERELHPFYRPMGDVKAQETIKFSIVSHRGCFGDCAFCSIAFHQGRQVVSRSPRSILDEIKKIASLKDFKGYILDIGGPTANMFAVSCKTKGLAGSCSDRNCLIPTVCPNLIFGHDKQMNLLKEASGIQGIKKVFVASGIRHDMVCADSQGGFKYLKALIDNHISGQMKIAPEHCDDKVLALMKKPPNQALIRFIDMFEKAKEGKNIFLTYYFIAAFPGCGLKESQNLKNFTDKFLKINPKQVQIFMPSPSSNAALMYYVQKDLDGADLFVEKDRNNKQKQKNILIQERGGGQRRAAKRRSSWDRGAAAKLRRSMRTAKRR